MLGNSLGKSGTNGFVLHKPVVSAASTSSSNSNSSSASSSWASILQAERDYNNAFNLAQVEKLNAFNAAEAQKNRDFQERMSRNSYTYAIEDLQRAGLNPVLAALNGGAATPSGSAASGSKANADDTLSSGLISLMGAMISSNSAMSIAQMQMQNQRWMMENNPNSVYNVVNGILSGLGFGDPGASGLKSKNALNDLIGTYKGYAKDWYGNGINGYFKKLNSYRK